MLKVAGWRQCLASHSWSEYKSVEVTYRHAYLSSTSCDLDCSRMFKYIHLLTILADAFIKLCGKGAKRSDHLHHVTHQLCTCMFLTWTPLSLPPCYRALHPFPTGIQLPSKFLWGPRVPLPYLKDKKTKAHMPAILFLLLPSQMILKHFIGAFQGMISSHYFTGLTEPTHICNKKTGPGIFAKKLLRKTWGTKERSSALWQ